MTKHILQNSQQVYHAWAHQVSTHGNNPSFSASYECGRAFSYNVLIAMMHNATKYVLLNKHTYSCETNKHQGYVYDAIPHNMRSKCISIFSAETNTRSVIEGFGYAYKWYNEKLFKCREKQQLYYDKLADLHSEMKKYLSFLKACAKLSLTDNHELAHPRDMAKLKVLIRFFNDYETIKAESEKYKNKMAKIEIANTKRYKKEAEGNLLKWRHNEDRDLKFSEFYHFRGDLIKISTCGGYLVTHRYGEIPFKVGVKMLEFYGKIKDDPDYVPNLKLPISFKGTHYTIDEIHISESVYAESYVIIGCHRFYFDELDRIYNMIFTEKKTN